MVTSCALFAQETTGGLAGTVKDATGAVVRDAHVEVTGTALEGSKSLNTDSTGTYHFANLPPGVYTITVTAKGFKVTKREGLNLEVGHLPTVDIALEVGTAAEVVEVSGQAPVIDVTTNTNQTNITSDQIADIPHGYTFQSVIQFAPMARNEPLAGGSAGMTGNAGGSLPGSAGNGLGYGFSIGGAADSESTYLVEGQDTENIAGGASQANVPFQFIQEVQVKTSGIEAEHGGALGGVVNVVMKKGSNGYHGSLFATYESDGADADQTNAFLRYDPITPPVGGADPNPQDYQAKQDHFKIVQPGFTVGGPIAKDRLWFFLGFAPQINSRARSVNFGSPLCIQGTQNICQNYNLGEQYFTQDRQTYFGSARLDATLTQKIRVFGSWLIQYARETGDNLPDNDPVKSQAATYFNTSITNPIANFSHGLGWSAPNSTYNFGADITLTPKIVATTRFGYFFTNYHDFGWQTSTPDLVWNVNSVGAVDNTGAALPAALQASQGTQSAPYLNPFTVRNANKHYQFDEDVAFFKSGWGGTHNIKAGYQLNRLSNSISQNGNVPEVFMYPGAGQSHGASTSFGSTNCGLPATVSSGTPPVVTPGSGLEAEWTPNQPVASANLGVCAGQYGYMFVQDFATVLPQIAGDWNHALFVQDAWTIGHGLTLNLGIRIEKESLPVPAGVIPSGTAAPTAINFSWSDKIEPRLGAAWGSANGKMKIFGSYGVTNDVMKLLLAQTSWGAQAFEQCTYPLGPDGIAGSGGFQLSDINAVFVNGRACPNGLPSTQANFGGGAPPAALTDAGTGTSIVENVNFRPWEPIAPGVKPYRQHEYVLGWDYQVSRTLAFEARYDRRRLDHVIEDASLADPNVFEVYTVVNPGEGKNQTIDGYANYLQSLGSAFGEPNYSFNSSGAFGTCPQCPNNPKAVRNYDGMELRLTKTASKGWSGMFSYTWSRLWGNYTGLTTTDQVDGGNTGRNSPDTTRAFDEPFFYFGANGKSNSGPLPTDRPNTLKGDAYYRLPWKGNAQATTFGIFSYGYQGSPVSSYVDLGLASYGQPLESTYIFGHGQWANITGTAGNLTLGTPYLRRTPWYYQTDFNLSHEIKVNKNNEHQLLSFTATIPNLLNQRAVTAYYGGMNSIYYDNTPLQPNFANFGQGAQLYGALETGYTPQAWINGQTGTGGATAAAVTPSSWYGKNFLYQYGRSMRFGATFTF
ncbi:MAG TPA: TonB-dependent receptor [Candidatus Sulfotelmatobacter sp.]|nr:TonB-dependent receptor [Candidatus Sulfotelmatobacter sp.]